jgi:hypothetical protein
MAGGGSGVARALILAAGLAVAGGLVGRGFALSRAADRYVTVKGVSEREVRADVAIWPLRVSAADDDLAKAHERIQAAAVQIREFLSRHGIDPDQARAHSFSVQDANANQYRPANQVGSRFVIQQTLVVRTGEPEEVQAATEKIGELVAAGIVLASGGEYGASGPTYLFSGLSQLKPEMIAEATARAREAAAQFARDSGSRVGPIRRASQGTFEILPRDQAPGISEQSQLLKTVRVVSTVEYSLED